MSKLTWVILLVLSMAGIATFYPITKTLAGAIDPYVLAFFRYFIATLVLIPIMVQQHSLRLPPKNELPMFLLLAFLFVIPTALIVMGVALTNSVASAILVNTNALLVAILSPLLISELMTMRKMLGFIIGFAGVIAVVLNGESVAVALNSSYAFGSALLLTAALVSGLFGIYAKASVRKHDGLYVTFFASAFGSVMLALLLVARGGFQSLPDPTVSVILSLLAIGILCTAVPHVIWSSSLKHLDAHKAASFKLLIPIFVAFYSLFFLDEHFTLWMFLGLILTCIGIYLVQRDDTRAVPSHT
ncbi:hypothetical protein A3H16_00095 [Candidatus Kaiserbacteria bacterium RIFCSPLOWO2_12_FULL_53_8]|uniref:EamA domain-containing protein n=2 Tax=Candidatus Kaiseribacteriota TaxID=1752734 RepID=A0A1F6CTQ1_9BACT|nr:MAG: hypothetical protein A2851_01545 [Candidatus Kaiserbacteria bacterium RIFCSPHIGHO2_01_FULL_53_29]OGG92283.1 MAG: hypothetical protein A3H16_00095 [Candidatus Kaiserbacteria bacterium RIFCSPLOWO2_12_FULL_53_8]